MTRVAQSPAPATRQQVICALAVALEENDALFAELDRALRRAAFDPATGVLSGELRPGAHFAVWLGTPAPPFAGRGLFIDLVEGETAVTLVRCLAPHELLPA